MSGTRYQLEVNPKLPPRLERLNEIANNLWYSWDRPTRTLFARLGIKLWDAVGHSPKAFLKRVDQRRLNEVAEDPVFLGSLARVLSTYDTYRETPQRSHGIHLGENDLIAYFCAEFGFHESLPIYSGGLGILAGDHCKTASDLNLPFVGIGLLYRQGYFLQTIDPLGRQGATYTDADFDDLPITPVIKDGKELHVAVPFPDRQVWAKVWQARVGHVTLYLLDTDLERNSLHDRDIAHQLYGGDRTTRIEQEIVLGMGGVRALAEIGLKPTIWHINEGHAAFMILERARQLVTGGLDFASALEAVAANTIFTTHTAVPAGHDHFAEDMVRHYFQHCCAELGCDVETLIALGRAPGNPEFNMTALAIRGSRHQNGVSRIHGEVSSQICAGLWPQIDPQENPIDYVTNGVHVPTFLSDHWHDPFERLLGPGWSQRLTDSQCWKNIFEIPDQLYWSVRQTMKAQMLHLVRHRIGLQYARNHQGSQAHLDRLLRLADPENPNILTIGFARRFATYKRATLLFQNLSWLKQIIGNGERPVLFIFAGKAHPADKPGQALIQRIAEVAAMPEFEGHILLVEGYDLRLARRLVSGVDVWLNNPVYPLEASGTSGMKAGINGVINLSVLDGWWGEGYEATPGRENGWAIKPTSSAYDQGIDESRRDYEEARTLFEILQDKVVPLYYDRGPMGYSPGWLAMSKRSIATITPQFTSNRMVGEYVTKFYQPAARQWARYAQDGFAGARQLAAWKTRVRAAWPGIAIRRIDNSPRRIEFGGSLRFEVALRLNGLAPEDVRVEMLLTRPAANRQSREPRHFRLEYQGMAGEQEHRFVIDLTPDVCGKIEYRFRAFPYHDLQTHPLEMGMMVWI